MPMKTHQINLHPVYPTEEIDALMSQITTSSAGVKETLEKFGVAIVPAILNSEEIDSMNSGMWDALETLTGNKIQRNDQSTWVHYLDLLPSLSMMIQHHGIGHAQYLWDLRSNPKIVSIFALLWDVEEKELLVSFDGVAIGMPPEVVKRGFYKGHYWLHSDQSPTRNSFECAQSWVTGFDVRQDDATLIVLLGSHLHHGEYAKKYSADSTKDEFQLTSDQVSFYVEEKNCKPVPIQCPAGSIVLWDSRTIHHGLQPLKTRARSIMRNVAYICMTPRKLAKAKDLVKKVKIFNARRMTTHWPHRPKMFSKQQRLYSRKAPVVSPLPKPILNELGKSLAGF